MAGCVQLCRAFRLRQPPEIREAKDITSPLLLGIIRPAIVFPTGMLAGANAEERDWMLAHELAHVKRRDLLWNWLPLLAHGLLFFHPLVWLAQREWRLAMEVACDELAVRVTNCPLADYGNMLLNFSLHHPPSSRVGLGTVAVAESYQSLKRRLIAMRHVRPLSRRRLVGAVGLVTLLALIGIVPWIIKLVPVGPSHSRWGEAIRHVHLRLESVTRHVKGPWNPWSKRIAPCTPYAAVRWRDSVPEVQVQDIWYELVSLDDIPAEEIVSFCKKTHGRIWRKRFEEDLVVVLREMGKQGYADSETGALTVRRLDGGETVVLQDAAWTVANRDAILTTALAAWKANGRKQDPRDDPSYP
jgi:hypothetical protein